MLGVYAVQLESLVPCGLEYLSQFVHDAEIVDIYLADLVPPIQFGLPLVGSQLAALSLRSSVMPVRTCCP